MDRRDKGSGQITHVNEPTRKSKWKATVTDTRGKKRTRYFKTEREAKAFLREINSDEKKLKVLMDEGVTFEAFSQVFLEEKKKANLKVTAYTTLSQNIDRVNEYLGDYNLRDIDSDVVQQMIFALAKKDYSVSVLTKSKIAVNSVLKMAASKHFLDVLPVMNITIPAPKKQDNDKLAKNNWMKDTEVADYEEECKRTYIPKKYTKYAGQELMVHPAGYKLLFILHTGLRLGEALALTWPDYDEFSKTLLIDKNVVYTSNGKVTQTPKTEAGERVIILNKQAVADLEMLKKQYDEQTALIEAHRKEALKEAERQYSGPEQKAMKRQINEAHDAYLREHKYICGSSTFPYGSSGHSSTKQTHDKICRQIGLTHKVTVHGLRHTYVTHYYIRHKNDPDFDLATFSKSIGHSSIRTTMEIYAHLDMTQNRYVARAVEDLKEF